MEEEKLKATQEWYKHQILQEKRNKKNISLFITASLSSLNHPISFYLLSFQNSN